MNFCNGMMFGGLRTSIASQVNRPSKTLFGVVCAVVVCFCCASETQATLIAWGDPVLGHSWDQFWQKTSPTDFDAFTGTILAPATSEFKSPGILSISTADGAWFVDGMVATQVAAHGADTKVLEFKTHLEGLPSDYTTSNPLTIRFDFSYHGSVIDESVVMFDGTSWSGAPLSVPDGGTTLLLLGMTACGFRLFRKRLA
jgi:hypothetical protein